MLFRFLTLLCLLFCLPAPQVDSRSFVSGWPVNSSPQTTTVNAIVLTPSPGSGSSSDPPFTVWATLSTLNTPSNIQVSNPSYSIVSSSPAGFHGTINGNGIVATSTPTSAGTYTLTLRVDGSNIANTGGFFSQPNNSVVITTLITMTGVNCPPASAVAGGPQGTLVGQCVGVYSGGTPPGEIITISNTQSNKFQVTGNNLQFGSSPPPAGSYTSGAGTAPTVTVTNAGATNSPQTYPVNVTITNAVVSMTTPVTCTPIASGCAGVVGDTVGKSLGTLAATASGGTPGALTCVADSATDSAMANGRFQVTTGCVIKTGSVPYTVGTYTVTPSFNCGNCTGGPFALPFSITVNSNGSTTLVQARTLLNNDTGTHTAGFWLDGGQPFGDGQIKPGDGVIWKAGDGVTIIPSQIDDMTYWPDGSLKFASFTLQYPNSLVASAQDTPGAYDVPGGAPSNRNCTATAPNTVAQKLLSHNFNLRINISGTEYFLYANNEQNNRAATNVRVTRTGPLMCSLYIFGEMRNGSGATATPQGQIWGAMYIDFRSDGTYRIWSQIMECRPVDGTGAIFPACPTLTLAADGSGNEYALFDNTTVLMGCDDLGCTKNGNAGGNITADGFPGGYTLYAVDADAFPYDTAQDASKIVFSFPLPTASDSTSRGIYDAKLLPWFGYTPAQIALNNAAIHPAFSYKPFVCAPDASNCAYGTTGDNPYIGMASSYAMYVWYAGTGSNAAYQWAYDRKYALVVGSLNYVERDPTNGYQINLDTLCTTACAGMTKNVNVSYPPGNNSYPIHGPHGGPATNHSPNFGFWECVMTGYRPFCDIVRDTASTDVMTFSPGARNGTMNSKTFSSVIIFNPQTRQMAWNERDITSAAWLSPDFLADGVTANPEKAFYKDIVDGPGGSFAYFNQWFVPPHYGTTGPNPQSTLGWMFDGISGGGFGHTSAPGANPGGMANTAPWQDNYWMTQVALDLSRGWTNLTIGGPFFTEYVQKHWLAEAIDGCQSTGTVAFGTTVQIPSRVYSQASDGILGIMAQNWTDLYFGDLSSYVFPKFSMYVDVRTSAPPVTSMHVFLQNATDASNLSVNSAIVSQGAFLTEQPQTGGPSWTAPDETYLTSVTYDSPGSLGATITLNHGLTGTVPIPTGTFHGYIVPDPAKSPPTAGLLTITSIDSGSLLGGMKIFDAGGLVTLNTNFLASAMPTTTGTYSVNIPQTVGSSGSPIAMSAYVPFNIINFNGSHAQPATNRTQGLVPMVPPNGCNVLASPTNTIAGTELPNGGFLGASGTLYLSASSDYYAMYFYAAVHVLAELGVPRAILMQNWFENTAIPTSDSVAGQGIPSPPPWHWWGDTKAEYGTQPQMRLKPPAFNP